MVGVARIELATPAMSTQCQSQKRAVISHLSCSICENERRTTPEHRRFSPHSHHRSDQVTPRYPLVSKSPVQQINTMLERPPIPTAIAVQRDGRFWFWMDPQTGREVYPEVSDKEWFEQLHEIADRAVGVSQCYFIGGDESAIKIGYSVSPRLRLKSLQSSCPIPLRLLATAPGGQERESAYHVQFDEYRLHGEWFQRCEPILDEIERLNAA